MSREIRRVPVDFDWPLDKVREGHLSPEMTPAEREQAYREAAAARRRLPAFTMTTNSGGEEKTNA